MAPDIFTDLLPQFIHQLELIGASDLVLHVAYRRSETRDAVCTLVAPAGLRSPTSPRALTGGKQRRGRSARPLLICVHSSP